MAVSAAEANVKATIEACDAYGELGVRAVAIVAPFYYRLSSEGVYAYFREIAENVQVDVTLYNIPLFASPIDVETVVRLASEFPRVIGIKDSSGDLPNMMRMISAVKSIRPDFSFLTGWEAALMPMLLIGADGGTNATSGIMPEITRKLYELTRAGEIEQARDLQYRLLPIFDAMIYSSEFPEGFRAALQLRGFKTGRGRQPQSELQLKQLEDLSRKLQCLLAEEGFTDEPLGGCHATHDQQSSELDPAKIAKIVKDVIREMQ